MGKIQSTLGFDESSIDEQRKKYSLIEGVTDVTQDTTGNAFIHRLVKVILDDSKIIGTGDFMKTNHKFFIDFNSRFTCSDC